MKKKSLHSSIIYKSLNPTWNERFTLSSKKRFSEALTFKLWDKDTLMDDFMGVVEVDIREFIDGQTYDAWYPLKNKEGEKSVKHKGELHLKITLHRGEK